jgi:hypothetical protein
MRKVFKSLLLVVCMTLTGCASYQASSLGNLSPILVTSNKTGLHDDVIVCAKTFDKNDCKKYLDRDVIGHGYYPVQIYIENNSDRDYLFSLNRVSLPCARPEEVAEKVHTSTVGRVAGYGAAAFFTCALFVIPAIIDGVKSSNANTALDSDFGAKAARDHVIYQHSHSNMLMFVPSNAYQPTFTVTLIDQSSNRSKLFRVSAIH